MAKKTITALFDSYERASEAVRRLENMGISHSDISIVASNADNRYSTGTTTSSAKADDVADDAGDGAGTGATLGTVLGGGAGLLAGLGMLAIPGLGPVVAAGWLVTTLVGAGAGAAAGGLLGSLVGAGVSEADAQVYEEGVRRGGTLVTVRADDAQVDRVVDVLDDHGSVDIDERSRSWRSEGWTGSTTDTTAAGSTYSGSSALGAAAGLGSTGMSSDTTQSTTDTSDRTDYDRPGTGAVGATAMGSGATSSGTGSTATDVDRTRSTKEGEEAIPIVEEELHVDKRQVEHGRVRVHSHVVETPVQEQVTLRDEEVRVERRPVDRPLAGTEAAFQDRTIETVERDEQAVVSKDARVTEELVVKKDVDERTETVSDTVRRTEVEVDDERSRTAGTTGTSTDRKI